VTTSEPTNDEMIRRGLALLKPLRKALFATGLIDGPKDRPPCLAVAVALSYITVEWLRTCMIMESSGPRAMTTAEAKERLKNIINRL
jgi:hypothetical protein